MGAGLAPESGENIPARTFAPISPSFLPRSGISANTLVY
jgi:hypothetical protein